MTAVTTRFPSAHIVVCETRVQGRGAPRAIVAGLQRLAAHPDVDVVVVSRGGGSFEDLLPFSDEGVVRAVAACAVPRRVRGRARAGHAAVRPRCGRARVDSDGGRTARRAGAGQPAGHVGAGARRPDAQPQALRGAGRRAGRARRRTARTRRRDACSSESASRSTRPVGACRALSPHATVSRGYAIVRSGGAVVREAGALAVGERLDVELAHGELGARVEEVRG